MQLQKKETDYNLDLKIQYVLLPNKLVQVHIFYIILCSSVLLLCVFQSTPIFLMISFPVFFPLLSFVEEMREILAPQGMAERFRDIEVSLDGKEKYGTYILRTFHLKYKPRRVSNPDVV